jgi:hypothetical protein
MRDADTFPITPLCDGPSQVGTYAAYKENARAFGEFGGWSAGAATIVGIADREEIPTVSMTRGVLRAL